MPRNELDGTDDKKMEVAFVNSMRVLDGLNQKERKFVLKHLQNWSKLKSAGGL